MKREQLWNIDGTVLDRYEFMGHVKENKPLFAESRNCRMCFEFVLPNCLCEIHCIIQCIWQMISERFQKYAVMGSK